MVQLYEEREKRVTRNCCKRHACKQVQVFRCNNLGKRKRVSLSASAVLYFPGIYSQKKTMTNEGPKKRPAPTAATASTYLLVVNIGNAPIPEVPRYFHLCWNLTVLWGSVSAGFRPFHREVGEGGGRGRKVRDR